MRPRQHNHAIRRPSLRGRSFTHFSLHEHRHARETALVRRAWRRGIARPIAASPAQPFALDGCQDMGDGLTSCFAVSGVSQGNYARAGNLKVAVNAKVDDSFTYQGQPVITQRVTFHFNAHFKDGEPQVMQQTQRNWLPFTDNLTGSGITLTCSYASSVIYANGNVRHDLTSGGCA